ncbi:MAG: AAA family ATPase [Candidatus Sericytochromatia bacterium]|nr:AAA family ATPase [Candidatus Sericytochromatia bacterium]
MADATHTRQSTYLRHFGLIELPFTLSDNPRFHHLTPNLQASLERLLLCVESRNGLASIIGDWGTGKSMLLRRLQEQLVEMGGYDVRYITNPAGLTGLALLKTICQAFDLPKMRTKEEQMEIWRRFTMQCLSENRHPVIFLDEAHDLGSAQGGLGALAMVKALHNFAGTEGGRAVTIILAGTDQLRAKLKRHREVLSRIATHCNLKPFKLAEFKGMIAHRLAEAEYGGELDELFDEAVIGALHEAAEGIPRAGCVLAGAAMEVAVAAHAYSVTAEMVAQAVDMQAI